MMNNECVMLGILEFGRLKNIKIFHRCATTKDVQVLLCASDVVTLKIDIVATLLT